MITRSEIEIRYALQRFVDHVWNKEPRRTCLTIPRDEANDADCILEDAVDELVALRAENVEARKVLWSGHGHQGLYGDDGEMQCATCGIDYKRDTMENVLKANLSALRALHARIATLEAELTQERAWHAVAKSEREDYCNRAQRWYEQRNLAVTAEARADAAQWQAFAREWLLIGTRMEMEREHDWRCDALEDRDAAIETVLRLRKERDAAIACANESTGTVMTMCAERDQALARAATAEVTAFAMWQEAWVVWDSIVDAWCLRSDFEKLCEDYTDAEREKDEAHARAATAERDQERMLRALVDARATIKIADETPTAFTNGQANVTLKRIAEALGDDDAARRATTGETCGQCSSPDCEGTHMKTEHEGHGKLCPFPTLPCCCRIAPAPKGEFFAELEDGHAPMAVPGKKVSSE